MRGWNGPFIDYLCKVTKQKDENISRDIQQGVPIIGDLLRYSVSAKDKSDDSGRPSSVDVWNGEHQNNGGYVDSLTENQKNHLIWTTIEEEVNYGAMGPTRPIFGPTNTADCV